MMLSRGGSAVAAVKHACATKLHLQIRGGTTTVVILSNRGASSMMIIFSVVGLVWANSWESACGKGPRCSDARAPKPNEGHRLEGPGVALLAWCLQLEAAGVLLGISQHALALKSLLGASGL